MASLFFIVLSATSTLSTSSEYAQSYVFTHNEDIWCKIIGDEYLDCCAIYALAISDTIRYRLINSCAYLKKLRLEYEIRCAIKQLKAEKHAILNDCGTFRGSSNDALMEQYLRGFYGELMSFYCFDLMSDSNKSSLLKDQIISIDKLLTEHRTRYNLTIIPKKSLYMNTTQDENLTFDEFISLQQESEHLLLQIQAVFGKFSSEYACNARLMMQAIGLRIGFPGIMEFDRYPRWGLAIICVARNKQITMMWKDLLHYGLRFNDSLFVRKLAFSAILKQVPQANIICDSVLSLLEKIEKKFLELPLF